MPTEKSDISQDSPPTIAQLENLSVERILSKLILSNADHVRNFIEDIACMVSEYFCLRFAMLQHESTAPDIDHLLVLQRARLLCHGSALQHPDWNTITVLELWARTFLAISVKLDPFVSPGRLSSPPGAKNAFVYGMIKFINTRFGKGQWYDFKTESGQRQDILNFTEYWMTEHANELRQRIATLVLGGDDHDARDDASASSQGLSPTTRESAPSPMEGSSQQPQVDKQASTSQTASED